MVCFFLCEYVHGVTGNKIVLTGDFGRTGLAEAAAFAPLAGLDLPGVDRFQVPHHGSRRNVSTDLLDMWLGQRLESMPKAGSELFSAYISAGKDDDKHPRKAVVRAMIHRGARVHQTKGNSIRTGHNAPDRVGWGPITPLPYPEDQED